MEIPEQHDQPTRQRVARSILLNGPSTAAELAQRLELTPAAVRRHLDHLIEEGTLEARDRRSKGVRGRGRPAKEFALTEAGRRIYDSIVPEALGFESRVMSVLTPQEQALLGALVDRLTTRARAMVPEGGIQP